MAVRRGECLELRAPQPRTAFVGYEYTLPIPGEVYIAEVGLTLRAVIVREAFAQERSEPDNLLSADLLGPELTVRNWRPGDRFWPVHTRFRREAEAALLREAHSGGTAAELASRAQGRGDRLGARVSGGEGYAPGAEAAMA